MTSVSHLLATALIKTGRFIVWFYYSPVSIVGRNHIPQSGPVLLVANHANSLIDPVLVGLSANRRVSFLAKAPLFEVPLFGRLMRWIGMIPVHRPQDDPTQTRRSLLSLARAAESLAAGSAVGIFPEGKSHDLRALTEVLGGTARMIQQALEAGATGLQVVPVGINYDDKRRFGSAVWIEVGKPIDAAGIIAQAKSTPDARHLLTREIAARLREVIIHLDDHTLEPFLEDLEILDPALQPSGGERILSLHQRKSTADALNYFRKTRGEKVTSLGRALVVHRARLKEHGLQVRSELVNVSNPRRLRTLVWRTLRLGLGLLPVLCGVIQNVVPMAIERLAVRFLPQAGATTIASSRLAVGFPIFLLWYAFSWWLLAGYFLPWVAWTWVLAAPFAGLLAFGYFRNFASVLRDWRLEFGMLGNREALKQLRTTQARLRSRLGSLSDEYAALRTPIPAKPPRVHENPVFRRTLLTAVLVSGAVFVVICGVRVGFKGYTLDVLLRPAPNFSRVDRASMDLVMTGDEKRLSNVLDGLTALDGDIDSLRSGFDSNRLSFLDDADNDRLAQAMLTYLNCRQELLGLILRYRAKHTIADPHLQLRASLVDLGAGCGLYHYSSRFVSTFAGAPQARRKLNEGVPSWGIPSGLYDTMNANLHDERNLGPFRAALADYHAASTRYEAAGLSRSEPQASFHLLIKETAVAPRVDSGFFSKMLREADDLRASALYQGQSAISRAVGSTRVRERSEGPRVRPEHLERIRQLVKPGDILLERQDWYLSRAFMPGYWAHAAVYIGTPQEVEALGLRSHSWVAPHWGEFERLGAHGPVHAIIEAVPEGVRFTTLEHCLGVADSAAILRPILTTRDETNEAVARAFHHLGKSYDFEFDFFTADKLVCTELVVRAYSNSTHLDFPLVNVMGRPTLPPTEMARKYSRERHTPSRQLDLILFLDGHAHGRQAIEGDEASFASTLDRPGLTWFSSLD